MNCSTELKFLQMNRRRRKKWPRNFDCAKSIVIYVKINSNLLNGWNKKKEVDNEWLNQTSKKSVFFFIKKKNLRGDIDGIYRHEINGIIDWGIWEEIKKDIIG